MSAGLRSYRSAVQIALAGTALALLGGCASDSTRLADPFSNTFSNPFQTASRVDPVPTGTIPEDMPARSGGVRSGPIESAPLPAPGAPSATPSSQHYGAAPHSQPSAAAPARLAQGGGVSGNWSAQGGAQITVGYGETASMLAGRYGVPTDALLKVNNLTSPAQVKQGTRLTIPVYSANAAAPAKATQTAALHGKPAAPTKTAADKPAKLVLVKGPGGKVVKTQAAQPAKIAAAKAKSATADAPKQAKTADAHQAPAKAEPISGKAAKAQVAPPKVQQAIVRGENKPAVDPQPTASLPKTDVAAVAPQFRWPARGRIIHGFTGNDGINIAVPEGTAVKAADDGVVAYAGSELKGYGNLVLIRHTNGFVSAYANNSALEVKRGEQVKRGQTIAKSGQTGNVATPQLHFELRKGSTPVDPTQYLAGL
ncbi:MAG: peptidoglycan DD-metalloendopeptidase family protein [Methylobacteriaceae bacterium]|nr:peptidoglycan DD-metalloendopeptidase family protein [Methylobacteriaceae bacterium]